MFPLCGADETRKNSLSFHCFFANFENAPANINAPKNLTDIIYRYYQKEYF